MLTLRAILTGCERRVVCWKPVLLVERPAQAPKTHNPNQPATNPSQLRFAVKCGRFYRAAKGRAEKESLPLQGVLGGEP